MYSVDSELSNPDLGYRRLTGIHSGHDKGDVCRPTKISSCQ